MECNDMIFKDKSKAPSFLLEDYLLVFKIISFNHDTSPFALNLESFSLALRCTFPSFVNEVSFPPIWYLKQPKWNSNGSCNVHNIKTKINIGFHDPLHKNFRFYLFMISYPKVHGKSKHNFFWKIKKKKKN